MFNEESSCYLKNEVDLDIKDPPIPGGLRGRNARMESDRTILPARSKAPARSSSPGHVLLEDAGRGPP